MNAFHRFGYLACLLVLAGCASTPIQTANTAPVEDKSTVPSIPSALSGGSNENGSYPAVKPGQNKNLDTAILRDPSSLLSKRSFYYDLDSFIIKDEYKPIIKTHANYLIKHPEAKLIIQGNTDERGSREYNLSLGQKRAEGIKQAFKLLGVSDNQIEAVSFGEEKPKNPESSEEAWAENRRSDLAYEHE